MKSIGGQNNYFRVLVCGVLFFALLATVNCGGGSRGVPAVDRNADHSANAVAAKNATDTAVIMIFIVCPPFFISRAFRPDILARATASFN